MAVAIGALIRIRVDGERGRTRNPVLAIAIMQLPVTKGCGQVSLRAADEFSFGASRGRTRSQAVGDRSVTAKRGYHNSEERDVGLGIADRLERCLSVLP